MAFYKISIESEITKVFRGRPQLRALKAFGAGSNSLPGKPGEIILWNALHGRNFGPAFGRIVIPDNVIGTVRAAERAAPVQGSGPSPAPT